MASWWCAIHGYRHPALDAAVREQLGRMAHVMFGGLTHEPAMRLAERLVELAPRGPASACSSPTPARCRSRSRSRWRSSTSARAGVRGRTRLLTVRGGYHGDTFGAMAVCDPVGGMHSLFAGVLRRARLRRAPARRVRRRLWTSAGRRTCASWSRAHAHELAAVIVEPVVQGAGGMRFHSPACVALLRALCDEHGLLLDARRDRHRLRAHRRAVRLRARRASRPDVMCVGKALTGGYMTLAATLCTPAVADGGLRRRGRRADARADLHGQPARVRGRAGLAGAARRRRLARAGRGDRAGAARGAGAGAGAAGRGGRARARARSAWCSSSATSTSRRRPRPRSSAACGCARFAT